MAIKLGCNAGIFEEVAEWVPGNNGCRSYRDNINQIPDIWPGVVGAQHTCVSLRPYPDDLLAGTLDAEILELLSTAPSGAQLTVWHEAGNLYSDVDFITPTNVRQMHVKMRNLCRQAGTGVRYGVCVYGRIAKMAEWIPYSGHPMDWYGIDVYDNDHSNNGSHFRTSWPNGKIDKAKIQTYLDEFKQLAQDRSGRENPAITIPECNSPIVSHRRWLFRYLAEWLSFNGGTRLYTFFKEGGPSSGPWLDPPEGQETIDGLNYIASHYCQ